MAIEKDRHIQGAKIPSDHLLIRWEGFKKIRINVMIQRYERADTQGTKFRS